MLEIGRNTSNMTSNVNMTLNCNNQTVCGTNETDLNVSLPDIGWNNDTVNMTFNMPLNCSNGTECVFNETDVDLPGPEWNDVELLQVIWGVFAVIFSVGGLHTNIVMLSVIISELRAKVCISTNVLLVSLCILDTCICCILLWEGFLMSDHYHMVWSDCPKFCYQVHIIGTVLAPTRQLFALALAINHHIVCTQSDAAYTRWCTLRNSLLVTVVIWLLAIAIIPYLLLTPPDLVMQVIKTCNVEFPYRHCHPGQNGVVSKVSREAALILLNTFPVFLMGIFSIKTRRKLQNLYRESDIPVPVQIAAGVLIRMAIVYSGLALPRTTWQVCNIIRIPMPSVLPIVFKFSQHVGSMVNPIVYGKEKPLFIKRYCLLPEGSAMADPYI